MIRIVAGAFAATLLLAGGAPAADPTTWFVRKGEPIDVVDVADAWQAGEDGLVATGERSRLDAGRCVGSGDSEVFARLKIDDITEDNASLMLDAAGARESGELILARRGHVVVRGFFFGDRTQEVRPVGDLIHSGEWFDLSVRREGDVVTFRIGGEPVWSMRFEKDRPFGKLTLKPGRARLTVRSFGMRGSTTPLDAWVPRLSRDHPIGGEDHVDVFTRGAGGYHTYRIPAIVRATSGSLLAFAEGRKNDARDHGDVDLVLRRSEDGGRSWKPRQLVYEEGGTALVTIGNPVPLVDRQSGRIWLFFCRDNERVLVTHSDDEGLTWATPTDLTATLKDDEWGSWYATGPGHGVQLASGRLVVPANHGLPEGGSRPHMIISDDHGASWRIGGMPDTRAGESTIAEFADNQLYVSMRSSDHDNSKPYCRKVAWSSDGGDVFGEPSHDHDLISSICQGSVLCVRRKDGSRTLFFSNPKSQRRERLTVRTSQDGGQTWTEGLLIYGGSAAYSDLVQIDEETLGVLFEKDLYGAITFVRLNLDAEGAHALE